MQNAWWPGSSGVIQAIPEGQGPLRPSEFDVKSEQEAAVTASPTTTDRRSKTLIVAAA